MRVRVLERLSFVTGAVLNPGDVVNVLAENGSRLLCARDGCSFPNVPRSSVQDERRASLKDRFAKAVEDLHEGSVEFGEILCDALSLHAMKSKDYGTGKDPYANVRASEEFGVPAWIGALIRANDKVTRLKQFSSRGTLANESAEDSMKDLVVYFAIVLLLYRGASGQTPDNPREAVAVQPPTAPNA